MIFHVHVSLCAGWKAQQQIFIITIFGLRVVLCQVAQKFGELEHTSYGFLHQVKMCALLQAIKPGRQ